MYQQIFRGNILDTIATKYNRRGFINHFMKIKILEWGVIKMILAFKKLFCNRDFMIYF